MTEVGEAVAAEIAGPDSTKCPFDCDCKCTATNDFTRVQKMGSNMSGGVPTIRFKKVGLNYENDTTPIEKKYPPHDSSFKNEWGWAAHHLIPVGSLKDHRLRKYLDKGCDGSKVSCDAGYDVNGVTNGKWLIGSGQMQKALKDTDVIAAVRRECQRAGIKVGKSIYTALLDDARSDSADPLRVRAWAYATMGHYQLQFHDSHDSTDGYNDFVKKVLDVINANLMRLEKACPGGDQCKAAGKKPMAPHRISRRLDHVSGRLNTLLQGPPVTWKKPVFTSVLSKKLAEEVHSKS